MVTLLRAERTSTRIHLLSLELKKNQKQKELAAALSECFACVASPSSHWAGEEPLA
jgi:hypothetical protein